MSKINECKWIVKWFYMFAGSYKRRYCPDFCCYQLLDTGMGGRLLEPRIRWWSPYSRPFRSTEKVPKKKGALKGIWVAMKDFPSTPIKMASLIGNTVNWRYCRIKWELTNQLGLNLESKWWMCTTMTLPVASHLWKKAEFSPSTRKILRVSVASPGRSNPS